MRSCTKKPRASGAFLRWAVLGSNQRPPACRAGALPTELTARTARGYQRGSRPRPPRAPPRPARGVGPARAHVYLERLARGVAPRPVGRGLEPLLGRQPRVADEAEVARGGLDAASVPPHRLGERAVRPVRHANAPQAHELRTLGEGHIVVGSDVARAPRAAVSSATMASSRRPRERTAPARRSRQAHPT